MNSPDCKKSARPLHNEVGNGRLTNAYLVYRCCELKAEIVGQDEKDKGIRSILNFGHTVGHALESYTGYRVYLHGEAIALGSLTLIRHLVTPEMMYYPSRFLTPLKRKEKKGLKRREEISWDKALSRWA